MPRTALASLCGLTAAALIVLFAGAMPENPAPRPPAPPSPIPPPRPWRSSGAIPISSASDEARQLYLAGPRARRRQLRAHDGRQLYEQAAAKDPTFAMAHYQLAANSATAKDFFAHLKEAVGAVRPRRPRASG